MSAHFQRVKAKMQKEIDSIHTHTPESWADIMLRNSAYLKTDEDQESFFNWILNPSDNLDYVPPVFKTVDPNLPIVIDKIQRMKVKDDSDEKTCEIDIEMDVEEHMNGLTSYSIVRPRVSQPALCKS